MLIFVSFNRHEGDPWRCPASDLVADIYENLTTIFFSAFFKIVNRDIIHPRFSRRVDYSEQSNLTYYTCRVIVRFRSKPQQNKQQGALSVQKKLFHSEQG